MKTRAGRCFEVSVYGFGSFFGRTSIYKDIDLLVIHSDISLPSCDFAIACKKRIKDQVDIAHITVLAQGEERQLEFIRKSMAIFIGKINSLSVDRDLQNLIRVVRSFEKEEYV